MTTQKYILLTIDVEDWFQVENFKPWIPFETWDHRELRVERNVHLLLDLFDSVAVGEELESLEDRKPGSLEGGKVGTNAEIEYQNKELNEPNQLNNSSESVSNSQLTTNKSHAAAPASNTQHTTYHKHTKKVRATFFVLGWIADRLPKLVREIQYRGHEVASHGCIHQLPEQLSADALKQDLTDSKKLLEDITGAEVVGYRAPSFAITDSILKTIEDCGYRYDSSYNSFGLHGRYGRISLNGTDKLGIARKISDNFYELPISNLRLAGQALPWGGGGYFRLAPYSLFRRGVQSILENDGAYAFYIHPWEIDPGQPRVREASWQFKLRHYSRLSKTFDRLKQLIKSFNNCAFITCNEYLIECV